MSEQPKWGEVVAWAKREIETARTKLETATAAEAPALQARITFLRDLQNMPEVPAAPDMPQVPSYT